MFETYYYIDEEKLDCYLSDFYRPKKLKNKGISLEVSLPFIKVSADGVFDKDISTLTARQKAILFESLLESNSQEVFFDLAEDSTDEEIIDFLIQIEYLKPEAIESVHLESYDNEMIEIVQTKDDYPIGRLEMIR